MVLFLFRSCISHTMESSFKRTFVKSCLLIESYEEDQANTILLEILRLWNMKYVHLTYPRQNDKFL